MHTRSYLADETRRELERAHATSSDAEGAAGMAGLFGLSDPITSILQMGWEGLAKTSRRRNRGNAGASAGEGADGERRRRRRMLLKRHKSGGDPEP